MNRYLVPILKAIAIITVVSGLLQMLRPGWVLAIVGGVSTDTSRHFFGIVGMFMVLFGAMLWQSMVSPRPQPLPVFWCGMQKLGATLAVGLGVSRELFSWMALPVAGFDFLSFIVILVYWLTIRGSRHAD